MKQWVPPLLLVLVSPALLAAPERVAAVLESLSTHGFVSPSAAVARLQAAQDAGDADAPVDQRRRYYAKLIALTVADRNAPLMQQALDQLQRMATQEHCKPCHTSWLIGKAETETAKRDLKSARTHLQQAAALISANDDPLQLELILAQVRLERKQGALNVAFTHAMKGVDLAETQGDVASRVMLQLDLTVIDAGLGYLPQAAKAALEATEQARDAGFTAALAQAYLNQGYVFSMLNERPGQLRSLQRALEVSRNVRGLKHVEATARTDLSDYYLHQKDYNAALKYGREGASLAQADDDLYITAVALANAGLAAAGMGDQKTALDTLQRSMDFARRSGNLRAQSVVSRELVKQLQASGRYQEALQALESIDDVNQKITQQKRDTAVLELQAKYDDERKNREIERLSTQARLKDAETTARRWQQSLWTVLAAVAVLIALTMVIRLARARHTNRQLVENVANLTEQSSLDELTGVYNRRHFASLMQPYEADPEARVGLVMVDIDRFKRINDRFGHDAGDVVLKEVARRLQSLGREYDSVVRWGGEEFVLVLPDASVQGMPIMAKRLLDAVAGRPVRIGNQELHVSISAGCVVHPLEPDSSWEPALKLADTAMYRAKRHGRNRAACVTMLNKPVEPDSGRDDPTGIIHASTVEIVEVAGPELPTEAVVS